jgi:cold shock CspA family protein
MVGTVTSFDESAGLGVITDSVGVEYPFHCVEITDGTRTIEVGAEVEFDQLRKLGRIEAAGIRPRDARERSR